jgi:hypothetical protein
MVKGAVGILGAFAKLVKATISFVVAVRLSMWNSSVSTGRIFMKIFGRFFRKIVEQIQV